MRITPTLETNWYKRTAWAILINSVENIQCWKCQSITQSSNSLTLWGKRSFIVVFGPFFPFLSKVSLVHALHNGLFKMNLNIICPFITCSSKFTLYFRVPQKQTNFCSGRWGMTTMTGEAVALLNLSGLGISKTYCCQQFSFIYSDHRRCGKRSGGMSLEGTVLWTAIHSLQRYYSLY
jgi:hypothetical protein